MYSVEKTRTHTQTYINVKRGVLGQNKQLGNNWENVLTENWDISRDLQNYLKWGITSNL